MLFCVFTSNVKLKRVLTNTKKESMGGDAEANSCYMSDIFELINVLNRTLQGKEAKQYSSMTK